VSTKKLAIALAQGGLPEGCWKRMDENKRNNITSEADLNSSDSFFLSYKKD